jgi:nucleotide-binding universal stress UspA family protein
MVLKRILVPVDFSANSLEALDYGFAFAKPFKATLAVLFVVEPIYYTVPDFTGGASAALGGLLDEQLRTARTQLRKLEQRYQKRGVKLRALLQTGTPAHAIAETARQIKADLIIMATHGRTGVAHLLLGSVAERVVRAATCPVLTLHPGQGRRGRRAPASARRSKNAVRRGAVRGA